MASELKSKAIRAGTWALFGELGLRVVQFVMAVILARILLPEQFGLIGMLMIFTAVAQTILDSGFGAALIQRKNATSIDIDSVFYFNIFVGVIVYLCLFQFSPKVADFYNQPVLAQLLRVISLTLVINSFGMIQNVLVMKSLDFQVQTKVTFFASVLSGVIGISMAYRGYGVWSIAVQQVSSSLIRTILFWLTSSWRPSLQFRFQSLREMFHFGSKLLASSLLDTVFDNIYLVVIGKLFPPAELGYYSRANNLQRLPSRTLAGVIGRVSFPVFSTIQDDPERIKRGMKQALSVMMLFNFPMMIGLAIVARPFILVLLTEKWAPCVVYLQLLCALGILYPLQLINLSILQAMGKSNLFLELEVIKKLLIVLSILITYRWGISAMIGGQIVVSFLSYGLNSYHNKRLINYSIVQQIHDISPYFSASVVMAIPVYCLVYLPISPSLLMLSQFAVGAFVYITICHLFRLEAYGEMQRMLFGSLWREFGEKKSV